MRGKELVDQLITVVCVVLILSALWFAITLPMTRPQYTIIFLGLSMVISTLTMLRKGSFLKLKEKWLTGLALLLILLAVVPSVYLFVEYIPLSVERAGAYTNIDYLFGGLIFIPLLLLVLKETGGTLFGLVLLFLFYSLFGYLFPGIFFHSGVSLWRIIQVDVLEFEAVYGLILGTMATWVAMFLLFAGLIQGFGSLDVLVKVFLRLFKSKLYLLPQLPVVTSMIFGCFSGSPGANAAGVGSFTIPLMKRFGIPAKMAGAIEAVASSGGQVMPPVMGAIAFLMAAILGVSYWHIALIGFIPAVIFYAGTAASTYWATKPYMAVVPLSAMADEAGPISGQEFGRLAPLVASVLVLFTFLALETPIMGSALYAIYAFLIAQIVYEIATIGGRPLRTVAREFSRNLMGGVKSAGISTAMVAILGGTLGIVMKALTLTALGPKLSFQLVELSQGSLLLMLIFILLLCMVFGMTVGGIATYIVVVGIVAVPLINFGVKPLVTHFIIFYLGSLAQITPPVAGAALVTASIAKAPYMGTAWQATRLGISLLIMPVAFAIYPEILDISARTPVAIAIITMAVIGISYGTNAPETDWKSMVKRTICVGASCFALFCPVRAYSIWASVVVLVVLVGGLFLRTISRVYGARSA